MRINSLCLNFVANDKSKSRNKKNTPSKIWIAAYEVNFLKLSPLYSETSRFDRTDYIAILDYINFYLLFSFISVLSEFSYDLTCDFHWLNTNDVILKLVDKDSILNYLRFRSPSSFAASKHHWVFQFTVPRPFWIPFSILSYLINTTHRFCSGQHESGSIFSNGCGL